MCGIIGAIAERNVVEILLGGLRRLEYRGYDSSGVALLNNDGTYNRVRRTGKVQELANAFDAQNVVGKVGIIKGTDVDQPRNLAKSVTVD